MYHPFSVPDTLKTAWYLLKRNISIVAIYSLIGFAIVMVMSFVIYFVLYGNLLTSLGIVTLLVGISFIFLGFIKLVFQLIDKEYYDFEFRDIVPDIKMLFSYLLLLILVSTLSVFITNAIKALDQGWTQSILGIVTWIFFQFFFLFYFPICACFIVDDSSGPFESVIQSMQLIKGNFLKYFLLFAVIEVMVFVGSVTIVGMLFVIPFVNIILVVAYRKLIYSHQDVDDDLSETT
ncbi:MAG: hypothetical protein JST19_05935 [Bacteroidetes bacterium]|nr:hypothetical protein [Bacteroidota bacterium]